MFYCVNRDGNHTQLIRSFNRKVGEYNEKQNSAQRSQNEIEEKLSHLSKQEKFLNECQLLFQKHNPTFKTIMTIGPTGYGKSLICNRLIGKVKIVLIWNKNHKNYSKM